MKKYQQLIPLQDEEKVLIKAHATLDVEGWEGTDVSIETDLNVQRIRREDGGLYLMFVDDASVKIPAHANLIIQKANGNARVRNVNGVIEVNSVSGNLAIQKASRVKVSRVSGNCLVQDVAGDLEIQGVGGNLKGKDCYGNVQIDKVNAGIELLGLHRGIDARAMGDVHVSFLQESSEPVRLRSAASIDLNMSFALDAEMKVRTNAHLTELVLEGRQEVIKHRKHVLLVGEGKRKYDLEANGKIRVVAGQVEDRDMLKLFEELEVLWDELNNESNARREAETEEAGEMSLEEMQVAEQRVQEAMQQVNERLQSMGYENAGAEANLEAVNSEDDGDITGERLIVMRLVGENKISIEEADRLLEALEGYFK